MIIVFDLTNESSFENVNEHLEKISKTWAPKGIRVYLVGNKSDLDTERKVSYEDAIEYATKMGFNYFEISAKSGFNVEKMF